MATRDIVGGQWQPGRTTAPDDFWDFGTTDFGAYIPKMNVEQTFAERPADLWETARLAQMGSRGLLPQWQQQRFQGIEPALGSYYLAGGPGTFAEYMKAQAQTATTDLETRANWANAIAASRAMAVQDQPWLSEETTSVPPTTLTPQQVAMQQWMQPGSAGRASTLAMAGAGLGGGVGLGAQARQAALGNLYDLYAARAEATGTSPGTFLSWLSGKVGRQEPSAAPSAEAQRQQYAAPSEEAERQRYAAETQSAWERLGI